MVRGKRLLASGICLVSALFLGACGAKNKSVKLNPKSDGVMVQAPKSELEKAFPGQKLTAVSAQKNIYQLNATVDDVKSKLPNAPVEENKVMQIIGPLVETKDGNELKKMNSIREVIAKLNCVQSPTPPAAQIGHVSGGDFIILNNVRAGSSPITLTAAESTASRDEEGNGGNWLDFLKPQPAPATLEYHWVVQPPPGSNTSTYSNEVQMIVNPDQNGGYLTVLIVQDPATRACDLTGVTIGATADVPYAGQQFEWGHTGDSRFYHLPMIRAEAAWENTQGEDTVVAIIDTGMNYNHPDIANKLYINTREIPNNRLDDDGNGYIDDVHGYDFAFGDNIPFDDESHGTHVSGLVAGVQSGVAPGTKILPIKALYPTGSATLSSVVSSILYAVQMKADVINMSLGGEGEASAFIKNALEEANKAGILIVSASGNSGKNVDETPFYINEHQGAGILSVGATDMNGELTDYSNYGVNGVSIASPGGSAELPILSTHSYYNYGPYVAYPGTSMASPIVAGVAALVKSMNKSLTHLQVKEIIRASAVRLPHLNTKIQEGRFVNAQAAVEMAGQRMQAQVH